MNKPNYHSQIKADSYGESVNLKLTMVIASTIFPLSL